MLAGAIDAALAAQLGGRQPATVDVRWFTTEVRVHSSSDMLRDYVASQYEVDVEPAPDPGAGRVRQVHAVAEPHLLARLLQHRRDSPVVARKAFKHETYHQIDEDGCVALLPEGGTASHALVTRDGDTWLLLGGEAGPPGLALVRIIRELVREDLLDQGALMFHGSGARTPAGRGVFLAGSSGAGKTSAAVRLAGRGGCVIGTDRTLLVPRVDGWWVVGLPTSTRLGAGSVRALGIMDALGEVAPIRAINPFNQDLPDQSYQGMSEPKVSLSNREVHQLLGVRFAPAARAHEIILLARGGFRSRLLPPAQAREALREHLLAPDPDYPDQWLRPIRSPAPQAAAALRRLAALVSSVPVTRVQWHPRAHCDERTSERLLPAAAGGRLPQEGGTRDRGRR